MSKKDDELVNGCQRYLDTLKKRSQIVERQKEELRQAEEKKYARREYWRKMLYEINNNGMTVIVPDDSQLNKKEV